MNRIHVVSPVWRTRVPSCHGPVRMLSRRVWRRSGVTDTSSGLSAPVTAG